MGFILIIIELNKNTLIQIPKTQHFTCYLEFILLNIFYIFSILQFVAHPNVQQLLASIWYEGLPGFRQLNMVLQFLEVCRIGLLFPFFSIAYIVCPWASFSQKLRKPFIKFICSSSSYFTFLCKYWKTFSGGGHKSAQRSMFMTNLI